MIGSFRDGWLRAFFVDGERAMRIPADLDWRLFRKLQLIDDATMDADLRFPPSNHFKKRSGQIAGWHSIRINQQWRLIFRWDESTGKASDLYFDDHSYR